MNELWTKGRLYVLTALIGVALGALLVFLTLVTGLRGESDRLNASLDAATKSLAVAQDTDRQLTESNSRLQQQLASAGGLIARQANTITDQQSKLAGQQRIIDSAKQSVIGIGSTVTNGGGDIESRARAIAKVFDQLYRIYFVSAEGGKSPGS